MQNVSPHNQRFLDKLIGEFDLGLRILCSKNKTLQKPSSSDRIEKPLKIDEKRHAAALMRVNHSGEIAAQALYRGQRLSTPNPKLQDFFEQAANEETDHLHWTENRVCDLGGRLSRLNPLWYAGAFAIGYLVGKKSDAVSLGFMAETEKQVAKHLQKHLHRLPEHDQASRVVVQKMLEDELSHRHQAIERGGKALPGWGEVLMRVAAKFMTTTAYYW